MSENRLGQAITKNSVLLGAFAIAVALGLAATELLTRELREKALREVQSKALQEIISSDRHDNVLLDDIIEVNDKNLLKLKKPANVHIARKNSKVIAFIFPVTAPDGYGGAINSIVGINIDGTIAGVRVIQHKETPGLGDKVELKKSDWVLDFNDKSLYNPSNNRWKVRKDKGIFDAFTGATITPRAVVSSIYNALVYYDNNKELLLEKAVGLNSEQPSAPQELNNG